jgi:sugar fermentation stimulation protein A
MSYHNLECELAKDLIALGGRPVPGFGSSDCKACVSHLVFFSDPPLLNPGFTEIIFRYRSLIS